MAEEQSGYVERPDYRVDILPRRNEITVSINDKVLARSSHTLLVDEQDHGLVFYFPREDVDMSALVPTDDSSRCPYKGNASYWRLAEGDHPIAWTYDDPYPQVERIRGYIAFYQDRVSVSVGVATPAVVGYSR